MNTYNLQIILCSGTTAQFSETTVKASDFIIQSGVIRFYHDQKTVAVYPADKTIIKSILTNDYDDYDE